MKVPGIRLRLLPKIVALLWRSYAFCYAHLYGRLFFAGFGRNNFVHPTVSVRNYSSIYIGNSVTLNRNVCIWPSKLTIGDRVEINPGVCIYGDVIIGNNVMIAPHCMLAGGNHGVARNGIPMINQPCTSNGIVIKHDVWIGANSSVLDGVTIAEGCVIGAGSVVTKSTISYGIYGGVPATLLRKRT